MSEARNALELAVGKIGNANGELLKVAEKHGDDIAKEDYDKARYFLDQTIGKIWDKVDVVRDVAKATTGSFSLDSVEMPEKLTVTWIAESSGQAALRAAKAARESGPAMIASTTPAVDPKDGKALAKIIGGRLTKAAKAALESGAQSINTDFARQEPEAPAVPKKPAVIDDDDDGVSFLDED